MPSGRRQTEVSQGLLDAGPAGEISLLLHPGPCRAAPAARCGQSAAGDEQHPGSLQGDRLQRPVPPTPPGTVTPSALHEQTCSFQHLPSSRWRRQMAHLWENEPQETCEHTKEKVWGSPLTPSPSAAKGGDDCMKPMVPSKPPCCQGCQGAQLEEDTPRPPADHRTTCAGAVGRSSRRRDFNGSVPTRMSGAVP